MNAASTWLPLQDAAGARASDERAVAAGTTWPALMERAGGQLARTVVAAAGRAYGLRVCVVVGRGNNGGDGWIAARRLAALGAQVRVVAVDGVDAPTSDEAAEQRRRWLASGARSGGPDVLARDTEWCDVAVDCLLGTGARGAPRGPVLDGVEALLRARDRGARIVACDLPTGVQGDDGAVPGAAVRADVTVTFGALKRGHLLHPGAVLAGEVVVADIGTDAATAAAVWRVLTAAGAALPVPAVDADKRGRGVVLVVAGSAGMAGAAILCARGALAAGAGLVTVATPRSTQQVVAGAVPGALTLGLDEEDGAVAPGAAGALDEAIDHADVVVAGPGLTPTKGTRAVVDQLRASARRLVLDADALNVFRGEGVALAEHAGEIVLTPHARELGRLVGADAQPGAAWRAEVAAELAAATTSTVVAKGPGTVVTAADGRVWVTPTGGAGLAVGGSGDVLAGAIATALAAGRDVAATTAAVCWLHGLAGDLAGASTRGRSGSDDVVAAMGRALATATTLADVAPTWPFDRPWSPGMLPPRAAQAAS